MTHTTRHILNAIGATVVVIYLIAALCLIPNMHDEQTCQNVYIEVEDSADRQFINQQDIKQLLQKQDLYPLNKPYATIQTQQIEDCIQQQPYVQSVECYKTNQGDIHIIAQQRKPIFRVLSDENYYVDENGLIMPTGITTAYYVPLCTGYVTQQMAQNEILQFVHFLQDNPFWNAQIKQIHITPKQEVELIPNIGEHTILLGTWTDYEKKLKKLKIFYNELNYIGWQDWKEIDLRFKNQVVTRN